MSDLSKATDSELADELSRRGSLPRCPCGRWKTYIGVWDSDGKTLRCHGCLRAIAKCRCRVMTTIVPADQIEQIVGVQRHATRHYARAVSAEQTVYILHSEECRAMYDDLRDCPWSLALDRGIEEHDWSGREDVAVLVRVRDGRLVPDRGEGRVTLR